MLALLWLIPILPFAGFTVLALTGRRPGRTFSAVVGVGVIAASFAVWCLVALSFLSSPPPEGFFREELYTWMRVADFRPAIAFRFDALSLVMTGVVTFVGLLIHLYSAAFMRDDEGFSRFFAYMNLFVGSMLTLLLADDLLLLYLGWEGVGLCSYLLIGFWYQDPANGLAARKAFIVTRVGDVSMAIGLFVLFLNLGTLQIGEAMSRATAAWPVGSGLPVLAAALLLGGAVGKSAQLPLQTWLPDAMAGPTPVSALIHAATMVTAGVYLIARTNALFALAPAVLVAVAVVGVVTQLYAGFSALTQWDLKRVLAYSTISQIGYMFLALGVGAWSAAIFHFLTHAFFKALLFLAAGVVIVRMHEEHDVRKMGGLRKSLPLTFWTFLVGAASLAGLPLITAGFFSKDLILFHAYAGMGGGAWLFALGLVGSLLTGLYAFRVVFLVFFGAEQKKPTAERSLLMAVPLVVLAALSVVGGYLNLPHGLGDWPLLSGFLEGSVLPAMEVREGLGMSEGAAMLVAAVVALAGVGLAYLLYLPGRAVVARLAASPAGSALHHFFYSGWGFDWLYAQLFVRPYLWFARVDKDDVFDWLSRGSAWVAERLSAQVRAQETGVLRHYAVGVAVGAVLFVALVMLT